MKKFLCFLLVASLLMIVPSCGNVGEQSDEPIDVDMAGFSSTMVYSQVCNIFENYRDYVGKSIRLPGQFSTYEKGDGTIGYVCLVVDSTACCSVGFELVFKGDRAQSDDLPAEDDPILVTGIFNVEERDGKSYAQLVDVKLQ